MQVRPTPTRRDFLGGSAAAGAALLLGSGARAQDAAASERSLRLGVIGVGNRGRSNLDGVAHEGIAALCDVDGRFLAQAAKRFPEAKTYTDFRRMLAAEELDAVVVSTPDHTHAVATLDALERGLHVYCEKPLTHSVAEARRVREAARRAGVATQMGTQIHAGENYRRVVELVRAGAVGAVKEVYVFCGKGWWAPALPEGGGGEVPPHLDYELWTGPAHLLPYHEGYHPANWRRYWNYGGGTLADMACHYMDLPFWALSLEAPVDVEAEGPAVHADGTPEWLHARWTFPARGDAPPVVLHWYDGGRRPEILAEHGIDWGSGVLFVGERGMLLADYSHRRLMPEADFREFEPPAPSIAPSIGHYKEWLAACRAPAGERATTCSFEYGGALTETVLLGAAAFRAGAKLTWDAGAMRAAGADVQALLDRPYREGWS
ncbi:MAG: Gfo/Idh/MocA family oxidoreductase [Planctomycetota bacterium]